MAEKTFKYKVVVDVSAANGLKTIENSIKNITNGFNNLSKVQKNAFNSLNNSLTGTNNSLEKTINNVKNLGLALLTVKSIGGLLQASLSVAFDFGKKVVDAARFRQGTVGSLERFFPGQGKNIFKDTIDLANRTPADTKPLLQFEQQLAGAGISEETLKKLTLLRADVEAGNATQSQLDSMATVFQTAAGGSAPEVGNDFIQTFIGKSQYQRQLAKQLGMKDYATAPDIKIEKTIADARKAGKLTGNEYTNALVEAANARLKQTSIGQISRETAQGSIAGALSNFNNVFDNMLLSVDLDQMPGVKAFIKVINQVTEILSSKQFQTGLENIIDELFGGFKELAANPERIADGMKAFLAVLKEVAKVLGEIFSWIAKIATADSFEEALVDIVRGMKDVFIYLGELIGAGIKAALFGGPSVEQKKAAEKAYTDVHTPVGSPSLGINRDEMNQLQSRLGFKVDPKAKVDGGQTFDADHPFVISNNIVINGNADPTKTKEAVESGTKSGIDKAAAKHQLRKAGKAK